LTQIKKFAWGSVAVGLAMVVAMSMVVSTAYAAVTVTTTGASTAVPLSTNLATGNGNYTNLPATPVLTSTAGATDFAVGNTVVVTAPAGFQFDPTVVAPPTVGGGGTLALSNGAFSSNNSVVTYTVTTVATANNTLTFDQPLTVRPIFANTIGGDVTVSGTSGATGTLVPLTVTPRQTPYTFVWNNPAPATTTIAADGSQSVTWAANNAVFSVTDGGGVTVNNTPITFTAALGGFGAAGTNQTTINTNASGQLASALVYRGTGTAGTDTIVASINGQTTTFNMTLQTVSPAAGTPTTVTGTANRLAIAPNAAAADPAYTSPNNTATVTFRVTDAAGTGVNGRQVILSTNVGRIATVGNCSSTSGTSVVITTSTVTNVAGRVQADVCATAAGQTGDVTVTATDAALSAVTGTLALTSAGPAATVTTSWSDGVLTVEVVDSNGRRVANGTGIQVTLPTNVGAVSPSADTASVNGRVQFAIALTQATGNAVVTVRDSVGGTIRVNKSVDVTAAAPAPAPTPGDGSLTAPSFGTGNVGAAVFAGGTIEQLAAQVTAAGGIGVWSQDANGIWRAYLVAGPGVVNTGFNTAFAAGFPGATAVFVVR
jgi:hypothetical protein